MKFNQYTDPRDANKITLNPMKNRINDPNDPSKLNVRGKENSDKALQPRGTYRDLGLFDQMKIRANERQADRRSSYEPDVNPENEPLSNEEMLKSQGKEWSEEQQKWVPKTTPSSSLFPGSNPVTPNTGTAGPISTGSGLPDLEPTKVPEREFEQPVGGRLELKDATMVSPGGSDLELPANRPVPQATFDNPQYKEAMANPMDYGQYEPKPIAQPTADNIPNRSYLEKGIQPYQQQFTDPFSSLQQFVNPSSSADASEFSANPMSTASQPRNPDYEQQSEYQFGVNPLTNNSNEIGLSNTNPEYAQMNEPSIFEEEEVIEQKPSTPSTPSGTPRRGVSTIASRGYTPNEINTKVSKWKPKYENVDPSKHDIAYYKKVNYFDQLDKVADARLRAERKLDPNLSPKQKQQALNNLLAIQQKMQDQIEKDWERTWGKQSLKRYGGLATFNPGGGVSYTNNPAFVGKSNIDLLSENGDVAVPNLQPSSFWSDSQSFNKPQPTPFDNCTEDQKKDPTSPCYEGYTIDPNQQISDTLKKEMMDSNEVEIDVKNKNVYGVDLEAGLAVGNKLASVFPAIQNRREANKLLGNKKLRKTADALYANNPAGDPWQSKGQYSVSGSTYGEFDPRNAGQINYSGRSQYGGSIYKEGGVAYMSADELQKFMEEGGEIEFI
jgi:hypothetical protein